MAISSNAPVSLTDIQNEFGGTSPISLSEYYSAVSGVPASGAINMGAFRGKSASTTISANTNYLQINASDYISTGGTLIIPSSVWIWSDSTSIPALNVDVANATIVNNGKIIGRGGDGANAGNNNGEAGGPAIKISASGVQINNNSGAYIAAGGGGGGSSSVSSGAGLNGGGGGGAGGGRGGNGRYNNTNTAGGAGGTVGNAGNDGAPSGNAVRGRGGNQGGGGGSIYNVQSGTGYSNDRGGAGGGGGRSFTSGGGAGGTGYSYDGNASNGGAGGALNNVGGNSSPTSEKGGAGGGGGWGAAGGNGYGTTGGAGGAAIQIASGSAGYTNSGTIYGSNAATLQYPFVSGTNYVSNGSATSSLNSNFGSWSLHQTVWDYGQSGYIWTFTVASNATGTLRVRSTCDPDDAPRSNSGDDRILRLYKNGGQIASVSNAAYRNAVMDTNVSVSGGDVLKLYMDNSLDWRDLGAFERIVSIYITGV